MKLKVEGCLTEAGFKILTTPCPGPMTCRVGSTACANCEFIRHIIAEKDRQLAEARAEVERRKADYAEMNEERIKWLWGNMRRERLIKQMREALKLALLFVPENATDAIKLSEAALEAAERGER